MMYRVIRQPTVVESHGLKGKHSEIEYNLSNSVLDRDTPLSH